jgi:hypothetical protein
MISKLHLQERASEKSRLTARGPLSHDIKLHLQARPRKNSRHTVLAPLSHDPGVAHASARKQHIYHVQLCGAIHGFAICRTAAQSRTTHCPIAHQPDRASAAFRSRIQLPPGRAVDAARPRCKRRQVAL